MEDSIYVGDTARVPYGTKSATAVTNYSIEIGKFLKKMDNRINDLIHTQTVL